MNKRFAFPLAALIAGSAFAGSASAQTAVSPAMVDDSVAVQYLPPRSDDNSDTPVPAEVRHPTPQMISAAQDEIQADPNLMASLQSKNVQLDNVVAIETAGNGDKTVYVR